MKFKKTIDRNYRKVLKRHVDSIDKNIKDELETILFAIFENYDFDKSQIPLQMDERGGKLSLIKTKPFLSHVIEVYFDIVDGVYKFKINASCLNFTIEFNDKFLYRTERKKIYRKWKGMLDDNKIDLDCFITVTIPRYEVYADFFSFRLRKILRELITKRRKELYKEKVRDMARSLRKPKLILAFPGVGKSYCYRNQDELGYSILDSDSSHYSKDRNGERHEEFPGNYIQHIENVTGVDFLMCSTHKEVRDALIEKNIPFTIFYPDISMKDLYMERFRQRRSPEAFIRLMDEKWEQFVGEVEELTFTPEQIKMGFNKVKLHESYLSDWLGQFK